MTTRIVSLLATLLLVPMMGTAETIYDNGPQDIHEQYGAYGLTGPFWISNTFTVSSGTPTYNRAFDLDMDISWESQSGSPVDHQFPIQWWRHGLLQPDGAVHGLQLLCGWVRLQPLRRDG